RGRPPCPVCTGSRKVSRMARIYDTKPSVQTNKGRRAAQRFTRSISRRIRGRARCSLNSPPSHKRVLTIMASAIHTMPPCFLTRISSAFTCPRSPGRSATHPFSASPLRQRQVPGAFDQELLHRLPLATGACPPISNGALVKPKSRHDRLHRTPMSEQGHDEHHGLYRGAQAIEDRTSAGAEGFVALVTDEALLLARMDSDIAHADLAPGMAMLIGAECRRGVHDAPPGFVWKHAKRSMPGPPFLLQVSFTTVKWRATHFY